MSLTRAPSRGNPAFLHPIVGRWAPAGLLRRGLVVWNAEEKWLMPELIQLPIISAPAAGHKMGKKRKPHREDLPPGANLCDYCTAKCCHYFALPLDTPEDWNDFDTLRWFLIHDGATVFTEEDVWYLMVFSTCKHLRKDNLCGIYETRPKICRDYSTKNCEYEEDWVYDRYIEVPEQVEEYAEALLGPRKGKSIRSPKPGKVRVANGA
jgi:Fe-S-cluster containining protein